MFPLQNKHALRANRLELVTLCPSSHQTRRCLELPGSVDTCACFKVGSAHRVPTKLRNSKCLLQFYKDFLIAFSSLLPSLPAIISSFHFFPAFFLLTHPFCSKQSQCPTVPRADAGQLLPPELAPPSALLPPARAPPRSEPRGSPGSAEGREPGPGAPASLEGKRAAWCRSPRDPLSWSEPRHRAPSTFHSGETGGRSWARLGFGSRGQHRGPRGLPESSRGPALTLVSARPGSRSAVPRGSRRNKGRCPRPELGPAPRAPLLRPPRLLH